MPWRLRRHEPRARSFVDHTTASAEVARQLTPRQTCAASTSSTRRCPAARPAPRTATHRDVPAATPRLTGAPSRSSRPIRGRASCSARRAPASLPRWSTRSASRAWCRALPRASILPRRPASTSSALISVISQGRGAVLADGKPLQDDDGRQVRFRFRRRLDAQGPGHQPRRSAARTARTFQLTALVDQFYAEVQEMGGGRWDTSALLARLDR